MSRRTLTKDEIALNIDRRELAQLCANVAYQKHLLRIVRSAGIFATCSRVPTDAAAEAGRRELGLEVMRWVEEAAPGSLAKMLVTHGIPGISQPQPTEEPDERTDADPE